MTINPHFHIAGNGVSVSGIGSTDEEINRLRLCGTISQYSGSLGGDMSATWITRDDRHITRCFARWQDCVEYIRVSTIDEARYL